MFQDAVNRFDGFALFALEAVVVLVLATLVAEFLVGPAPDGFPAGQAGREDFPF